MTERTQRRAAERKTRKAEQKKLRHQTELAFAAGLTAACQPPQTPCPSLSEAAAFPACVEMAAEPATAFTLSPISEAQLTANRANALHSCGPKTEIGKSIAAQNNFRHGLTQTEDAFVLLASESKHDYAQLLSGFQSEWQPATETENSLVIRLANHEWLRRRALRLQNRFLNQDDGLITDTHNFNLYRRYEVQHERAFNKALSDLLRLRAIQIREQNGFESQARKNEKHEYQIRHLQHREKMHWFNEVSAQARMTLSQSKLVGVNLPDGPALRCTCAPGDPARCPEAIK